MVLFQPDDVNDQLVEMSFRAWLSRVTDQHCPLVLNQGTLVKFFIKPGMTFTSPGRDKYKIKILRYHDCPESIHLYKYICLKM